MAYLLGPKEKRSRAVGENLFLKMERSATSKSAFLRRPYRPGIHGKRRRQLSEYGAALLEKQKVKLVYGLSEEQLKRYFGQALREKTSTPEALARILETRLDSVVFRMGLAPSRSTARSYVSHGHFTVNGRRTNIPSHALRPGDKVAIRRESLSLPFVEKLRQHLKQYNPPAWLKVDKEAMNGEILRWPTLDELQIPYNLGRIVEFYSK
jgi:small subunit ribosomal protein S4